MPLFAKSALALSIALLLAGCASGPSTLPRAASPPPPVAPPPPPPPQVDTGQAMVQLVEISGQRSVARLAQRGALWNDPRLRIPLPPMMQRASRYLTLKGYARELLELQESINYSAELALADFAATLSNATQQLQWPGGVNIAGGDYAATAYFRTQRGASLRRELIPLVTQALAQTRAGAEYEALVQGAGPLGAFLAGPRDDLRAYVARYALDALFLSMAEQEVRLRHDAAGGGVDLLRRWYQQNHPEPLPVRASSLGAPAPDGASTFGP